MRRKVWLVIGVVLLGLASGFVVAPGRHQGVEEFLHHMYTHRADALVTGAPAPDLTLLYDRSSNGALIHEQGRIAYMQAWAKARGLQVISAKTELTNLRIRITGSTATVSVIIRTALNYRYAGGTTASRMGVGSWHALRLTQQSGTWQVTQEFYLDAMGDEWTEPFAPKEQPVLVKEAPALSERRAGAVAYAERYCGSAWGCGNNGDYNTKFRTYRNMGGDCANFASQVLTLGGGLKTDWSWRAAGRPKEGGPNWINAQSFTRFMLNSGRASLLGRGTYPTVAKQVSRLEPGDIVAYQRKGEITHVSVVTGRDAGDVPVVAAHTADRWRNPWDLGWDKETVFWFLHLR